MAKSKKMSTTQIIIPKTGFVLEGILENLAKDLGLTIQDNPSNPELGLNVDRVSVCPEFRLWYQRFEMDDEVEEEGLYLDKGHIEANFSTAEGKIDLIYEINRSKIISHEDLLVELGKRGSYIANRLTQESWIYSPRTKRRIVRMLSVQPEEITPLLKALIEYK